MRIHMLSLACGILAATLFTLPAARSRVWTDARAPVLAPTGSVCLFATDAGYLYSVPR